jgi:hypothetical protein
MCHVNAIFGQYLRYGSDEEKIVSFSNFSITPTFDLLSKLFIKYVLNIVIIIITTPYPTCFCPIYKEIC